MGDRILKPGGRAIAVIRVACLLALFMSFPVAARSEFLRLNPYTYVSSTGRSAVVVVPPGGSHTGLFILELSQPTTPQQFHPATARGRAIFLETNEYGVPARVLAGDSAYSVQGSFSLQFSRVRLGVAYGSQPYITVVEEGQTANGAALLGFVGIDPAILLTGNRGVALFEANQLLDEAQRQSIRAYTVRSDALEFNGEKLAASRIGILHEERPHPCASAEIAVAGQKKDARSSDFLILSDSPQGLSAILLADQTPGIIVTTKQGCEFRPLN